MTALREQAIRLIEGMPDERLHRAISFLQSMEDDIPCADVDEEALRSQAALRLLSELEKGMRSGEEKGWLDEAQVWASLRSRRDAV